MNPAMAVDFQRESGEKTANDSYAPQGQIMQVLREAGTDNDWRLCEEIRPGDQSRVTDPDSFSYATKFNPVYCLLSGGKVSVFPAPGSNPNAFKLYYVNNIPVDTTNGADLAYNHTDINFFPKDRIYLVVMYAGIKLLHANLAAKTLPTLPTALPSGYIPATLSADFASYNTAYGILTGYIDTDEDIELAQSKMGQMSTELNKLSTQIQEYSAKASEEGGRISADIQIFSAELQQFSSDLQKVSTDYQWMGTRYQELKGEYDQAFMLAAGTAKGQG